MPMDELRRITTAALLTALLAGGCGRTDETPARPPNLVLVVVDTLRRDHLGCYGSERDTSPRLDALAARGVRFERAYATAPWTIPSVASILTGLYPSGHGVKRITSQVPDEALTLAELLARRGYATAASVSSALVGAKYRFDQGFDVFREDCAGDNDFVSTPGVTRQGRELLRELSAGERPFFLFLHYFDPHYNYRDHEGCDFAASRAGRLEGDEDIKELRAIQEDLSAEELRFLVDLYDEEVRFTDEGIGGVLEELDALGLEGETVVVVTADHGEEFLDHGWLGHTRTLYDELVRVPLIVRGPGVGGAGRAVEEAVSLASLTPTLLELAGVDPGGHSFQAPSLAALLRSGGTSVAGTLFLEVDFVPGGRANEEKRTHKKAVLIERYKLIRDDQNGRLELYDLERDPGELRDLAAELPELVEELRSRLEAEEEFAREGSLGESERFIGAEELEELRKLGYAGD